jgi:hypothetical protein
MSSVDKKMKRLPISRWLPVIALLSVLSSSGHVRSDDDFPLAGQGPYIAGIRTLDFIDDARDGRDIIISLWYPALMPPENLDSLPTGEAKNTALSDLPPDLSSAPYPVVVYSHGYGGSRDELSSVLEPLVTHGFIVATVTHQDDHSARTLIDRPLDIRFVIDRLEEVNATGDLAGLMTLDKVGLIGTSDGGYTALTMTGARIDEAFMSQWGTGERIPSDVTDPRNWYGDWDWQMLKAYYALAADDRPTYCGDCFLPPLLCLHFR